MEGRGVRTPLIQSGNSDETQNEIHWQGMNRKSETELFSSAPLQQEINVSLLIRSSARRRGRESWSPQEQSRMCHCHVLHAG